MTPSLHVAARSLTASRAARLTSAVVLVAATLLSAGVPFADAEAQSRRRRVPAPPPAPTATTPRSATALSADLGEMLRRGTRSGDWGVMVTSVTRGDTLFARDADVAMLPASTMKLFTAAVALEQFGPNHRFSTDVLHDGAIREDGVIEGDLFLRGAGDPALGPRFMSPRSPTASVDALARIVADAGITHVRGNIVADATRFEARGVPDGWQTRYLNAGYAARVSALSLNENLVTIVVRPGGSLGSAVVEFEPATSGVAMTNRVRTVPGSGASVSAFTHPDGRVEVRGSVGRNSAARRYMLVVEDPARYTAGAFAEALRRAGVQVDGAVQARATPVDAVRLGGLPSPPLHALVSVMNRESVNIYAELLFRNAASAANTNSPGSAETGNVMLQRFMADDVGVSANAVFAADGSGLSVNDRATPRALVGLLGYAHSAPWSSAFHASLPVAGESETLRARMRNTPAAGNLHAKTGTTNTVISLAGYVTAENGEILAFAFVYNGTDRWNARATIDAMGATLGGFARG